MTRLVVGPFNRVEGDLELTLDVVDGFVREARVSTPLYRGFEQILVGGAPDHARASAPRHIGICSVSQSVAASAALRAFAGVAPARNGLLATNIAHAAENAADHLTHFYLFFMPDFARAEYAGASWFEAVAARFRATRGAAAATVLPARARLLEIVGLIAGKWPHALAFQPGGASCALDMSHRVRLIALIGAFRAFLEETLFGAPLDDVLAARTPDDLERLAATGDFGVFLRVARALDLESLGRGPGLLMSYGAYHSPEGPLWPAGLYDASGGAARPLDVGTIAEDSSHAWLRESDPDPARAETIPDAFKEGAYTFARAPRLGGAPVEVGAVARQAVAGEPLIRALLARGRGSNVCTRVVARLVEIARLADALASFARGLRPGDPLCEAAAAPAEGNGIGLVEAARGSLGHWLAVRQGHIARYQIVAPTTWNFSPRDSRGVPGPLEQALAGLEVGPHGAGAAAIQHVVRSFDPCMVCTAH
jgi:hydrogenase large subunit